MDGAGALLHGPQFTKHRRVPELQFETRVVEGHVTGQQAEALGPEVIYYATRLRGAGNGLAKRKLGFSPRRLEWLSEATMRSGAGPVFVG